MADTNGWKNRLANPLFRWRAEHGFTLEEIADLTGFSESMISRAERGLRQFSPEAKVMVARRLGVPVRELFDPEDVDVEAEAS